jgi:hypothetical protein
MGSAHANFRFAVQFLAKFNANLRRIAVDFADCWPKFADLHFLANFYPISLTFPVYFADFRPKFADPKFIEGDIQPQPQKPDTKQPTKSDKINLISRDDKTNLICRENNSLICRVVYRMPARLTPREYIYNQRTVE